MRRKINLRKNKKNVSLTFCCDDNMSMAIEKVLSNQSPEKYDNLSDLLRTCIRKSLPEIAKEVNASNFVWKEWTFGD